MKIKLASMALFALLAAACSNDPPPKAPAHKPAADAACPIDGKAPKGECPPGCVWTKDHCVKK